MFNCERRRACAGEYSGFSCSIVSVSFAGDFSAQSRRRHLAGAGAFPTFPFREIATALTPARLVHSYFAALAKNSHLRTVFTALRAAASLLAMTWRYGYTLGFNNANPY